MRVGEVREILAEFFVGFLAIDPPPGRFGEVGVGFSPLPGIGTPPAEPTGEPALTACLPENQLMRVHPL